MLTVLDDHEHNHVFGDKLRFASRAVTTISSGTGWTTTCPASARAVRPERPESHLTGSPILVQRRADGTAYAALRDVVASETLVLTNRP